MKSFWSGIINLLIDGFTYNTRGHFAHCLHYYATRKIYLRVLYAKPSIKIYLFMCACYLAFFSFSLGPRFHVYKWVLVSEPLGNYINPINTMGKIKKKSAIHPWEGVTLRCFLLLHATKARDVPDSTSHLLVS